MRRLPQAAASFKSGKGASKTAEVSSAYNEGKAAERFRFGKYNNKRIALREASQIQF
jgi:hypothetical protein